MEGARYDIYPRRYFDLSPTWFAWNRLTAADVYALREEPGFEGQGIYFWMNHPIQFVRLVGLVVQIDSVANGRFTLITLDDSSGANIEVKLESRQPNTGNEMEYPSNSTVDEVDLQMELGQPIISVRGKRLDIGTVIMAKGTITKFNNQRQISLKRVFFVKDTNTEASHWSQAAEWKRTKLSQPWVLTDQQRRDLDEKIHQTSLKQRKHDRKKRKLTAQRTRAKQQDEEKRAVLEKQFNTGAIAGSSRLPDYR